MPDPFRVVNISLLADAGPTGGKEGGKTLTSKASIS